MTRSFNYSERAGLRLAEWFEERESAAKRGRPVFARMLKLLRQGKAQGLVIHKIDRGARNLKDWADLGEMIDAGVEVHFATESLDLQTRGGRLFSGHPGGRRRGLHPEPERRDEERILWAAEARPVSDLRARGVP